MTPQPTFAAAVAEQLLEYAARYGVDTTPIGARIGLNEHEASSLDARIAAESVLALWEELPKACRDDEFGLNFGASIARPTSNLGTLLLSSADTLHQGITRFLENEVAFNGLVPTRLEVTAGEARIVVDPARAAGISVPRHALEAVLAWWWGMIEHAVATPITARSVEFIHVEPRVTREHRNTFGVEPRFECPRCVLAFEPELLERRLATRSAQLGSIAEHAAQRLAESAATASGDPIEAIRLRMASALDQGMTPSQQSIAKAMGLSTRTLQRNLSVGGTSFTTLYDDVRRERAENMLRQSSMSMQGIARRLGYRDAAGFFRAFRRWTGSTPGEFRSAHQPH